MSTTVTTTSRGLTRVVRGMPTSDGAGVRLTRVIGLHALPELDPFLMLDEFGSESANDYIAGFPDHPHRGFQTVTYMLEGRMRHRDNRGNEGLLVPGSVQWMNAGRGLVHSEMPEQESGRMRGFQLWINLPSREKMSEPGYQEFAPDAIPLADIGTGAKARVIAGEVAGVRGPVVGVSTQPLYLDLQLDANAQTVIEVPREHAGFVYVFEGAASVLAQDTKRLAKGELGVLGEGSQLVLQSGDAPARVLLVAAQPIGEPVARYGPFVMNTHAEIEQAVRDYQMGRFN